MGHSLGPAFGAETRVWNPSVEEENGLLVLRERFPDGGFQPRVNTGRSRSPWLMNLFLQMTRRMREGASGDPIGAMKYCISRSWRCGPSPARGGATRIATAPLI